MFERQHEWTAEPFSFVVSEVNTPDRGFDQRNGGSDVLANSRLVLNGKTEGGDWVEDMEEGGRKRRIVRFAEKAGWVEKWALGHTSCSWSFEDAIW